LVPNLAEIVRTFSRHHFFTLDRLQVLSSDLVSILFINEQFEPHVLILGLTKLTLSCKECGDFVGEDTGVCGADLRGVHIWVHTPWDALHYLGLIAPELYHVLVILQIARLEIAL